MKKDDCRRKITFEKKKSGLARVWPGRPGYGLTRQVITPADLLANPDQFSHRVDRIPCRLTALVRV